MEVKWRKDECILTTMSPFNINIWTPSTPEVSANALNLTNPERWFQSYFHSMLLVTYERKGLGDFLPLLNHLLAECFDSVTWIFYRYFSLWIITCQKKVKKGLIGNPVCEWKHVSSSSLLLFFIKCAKTIIYEAFMVRPCHFDEWLLLHKGGLPVFLFLCTYTPFTDSQNKMSVSNPCLPPVNNSNVPQNPL